MLNAEERTETARLANLLQWLEEEQKQGRGLLGQLQHLANQLSMTSREQGERMKAVEDGLTAVGPLLHRVARVEEEASQLRELVGRLLISQAELEERLEQAERARPAEVERERQGRLELWERLNALTQEVEATRSKQALLDEMGQRHQEALLHGQRQTEALYEQRLTLEGKLTRANAVGERLEQEIQRLNDELDSLRRQDEVALGRLQVLSEHLRQLDERQAGFTTGETVRQELGVALELLRAEQQRLVKDLAELEHHLQEQGARLGEQGQRLGQAEGKSHAVLERMEAAQQEIEEHRQRMVQLLASYVETEEQLKRRQITELEQESQELRRRLVRLKGG